LALLDLGEGRSKNGNDNISSSNNIVDRSFLRYNFPDNDEQYTGNDLYNNVLNTFPQIREISEVTSAFSTWKADGFESGEEFEKIENARLLKSTEYTFNPQLGYISLNFSLNSDEVLAVAYEYTAVGKSHMVGEFSTDGLDGDQTLILKLLKGTNLTPSFKNWDLMMKNIYAMGSYQVNKEDFIMNLLYTDDKTGNDINYLPEGSMNSPILIRLLGLDKVNSQNDAFPDGRFDYIEGVTVNSSNGRIIFPVLQPFGENLREAINDDVIAEKYLFQELYDTTLTVARQIAEKNKFKLKGEYKSSLSSEIYLNSFNIPQGSVVVTAGGRELVENVEYTVDYNLGRVHIIDDGLLASGTPIQISLESNSLYNIQTKTLMGAHLNYRLSDDFNIGGTIMNLSERPLTHKVGIGEEPISNTIWGLNTSYRTESQFLTTLIDKLPLIETKEKSSIMFDAEFAHLIPGHSKAIEEEGNAYLDDFEGSETSLDVKNFNSWVLSSTPSELFPEAALTNDLDYGSNRAWLAWYKIDPLFTRNESSTPGHLEDEDQSSHFVREIYEREIFPFKEYENNIPSALQVLSLAYYPNLRGPYNYDTDGLNPD
ncbi:cell surface protein SprA, partial [Candidatus Pacearchaeota archaeon]|nr:cell surface protein SprA [Candidatus Pacearchaeota archaeon]